ncbi:helix-turn-helix domain-containing protein [Microbacterium sp. KSW4-16]|uniref:helix-turn-helix domain-containing protein n=1 Tax=Microbacterium aurugineum TaxID=2851642 RepID=UPI0020BDD3D5|nr:helix-turn-helix domain-containing protein [Microbacterium aurugineum]MCK8469048.1 helix-turn-helix domain-containing protein [Microbacterium aurugineum]
MAADKKIANRRMFRGKGIVHFDYSSSSSPYPRAGDIQQYLDTAKLGITPTTPLDEYYLRLTAFSQMSFIEFQGSCVTGMWLRDAHSVNKAALLIVFDGSVVVEGIEVTAGQFALLKPGVVPVVVESKAKRNDVIVVSFGAHKLAGLPILTMDKQLIVTDMEDRSLEPLLAYLRSLCRMRPRGQSQTDVLEGLSQGLVRALLQAVLGTPPVTGSTYVRAMRLIESDFANPNLSGAVIAAKLGISVRSLQSAFEEHGEAVSVVLREARARAAIATRAANPSASARDIARLSGFAAESTMYRAIRELKSKPDVDLQLSADSELSW